MGLPSVLCSGQERETERTRAVCAYSCLEILEVKCERSEVRGQYSVLDSRLPVAQEERFVFLFFIFIIIICPAFLSVHTPLFNYNLASRSTPTKAK